MMVMTHMLAGAALAGAFGSQYIIAGLLGGLLPDFDVFTRQHRKDLHYPFFYAAAAVSALIAGYYASSSLWFQFSAFMIGASLHCFSDVLGSGIEPKPWMGNDKRGVYDHVFGKWRTARGYVYDGSPADLMICTVFAIPLLYAGLHWSIAAVLLFTGMLYTANRELIGEMMPENKDSKIEEVKAMLRNYRERDSENIRFFIKPKSWN